MRAAIIISSRIVSGRSEAFRVLVIIDRLEHCSTVYGITCEQVLLNFTESLVKIPGCDHNGADFPRTRGRRLISLSLMKKHLIIKHV